MIKFIFTKSSKKNFLKLEAAQQERILKKLKFLKQHDKLPTAIRSVNSIQPITHRLRVGQYRILLHLKLRKKDHFEFIITNIAHRREIYK